MEKIRSYFFSNESEISLKELQSAFPTTKNLNKIVETLKETNIILEVKPTIYKINSEIYKEIKKIKNEILVLLEKNALSSKFIKNKISKNLTVSVINKHLKDLIIEKKIVKLNNNLYTSVKYESEYSSKSRKSYFLNDNNELDTEMINQFVRVVTMVFQKKKKEEQKFFFEIDEIFEILKDLKISDIGILESDVRLLVDNMCYDEILDFIDEDNKKLYFILNT